MKTTRCLAHLGCCLIGLGLGLVLPLSAVAGAVPATASSAVQGSAASPRQQLAAIDLPFIQNRGQLDRRVAFYARTFAGTAFVTRAGALVLSLPGKPAAAAAAGEARSAGRGWALSETPVSRTPLRPQGDAASPTGVAVFQGRDPRHWQSDLPTFRAVDLGHPWPGIGYAIRAHGDTIERVFTVAPGADARAIRMRIRGAKRLALDHGRLIVATGNGPVTLSRPVAYQLIAGKRQEIRIAYTLKGDRYGFQLGPHDAAEPLVIDPLVQATYLGGSGYDNGSDGSAIAFGGNGQVYLTGVTNSTNFPGTAGGAQPSCAGGCAHDDAFVAELSSDLKTLIQVTYLGGSAFDAGNAISVGGNGQVYVAGNTASTDFPGTAGGAQTTCGGGCANSSGDVFIAELSGDLKTLVQATYLGGSAAESSEGLAIGSNGQVYVAGSTYSTDFPGTTGGAQTTNGGGKDAFIAELSGDLKTLKQATYLGGAGNDEGEPIVLASTGQIYLTGETNSKNFPGTAGGVQPSCGGGCANYDAFVAELSGDLKTLVQATYLGGSADEEGEALVLGGSGQIYVVGGTFSTDFPGTAGGLQPTCGGGCAKGSNAFIAELSGDLKTLKQATYLGGSGSDYGYGIAVSSNGQVYVAGDATSTDFPGTAGGVQPSCGGGCTNGGDAFIATTSGDLKTLLQATYLGGSGAEFNNILALNSVGEVYIVGTTSSSDVPKTAGGAQSANGGNEDVFVALLNGLAAAAPPTVTSPDVSTTANTVATVKVTLTGSGTLTLTAVSSNQTVLPDSGITGQNACTSAGSCTLTLMPAANQTGIATVGLTVNDSHGQSGAGQFKFTVNAAPPPPAKPQRGGAIGLWALFGLLGFTAWRVRWRTARRSQ